MKLRKIPYYITPWFLMAGASLTMGLLSFSGILAIWPLLLSLACVAFVLSVAYEGQIYLKNIIDAFKKLFKSNQLERQLAKSCLREHCFPEVPDPDRPQFFKDYEKQLHLLHRFDHKRLDKLSSERKRHVEKKLGDMEKWFSEQLFSTQDGLTAYQKELRAWLDKQKENGVKSLLAEFQAKKNTRKIIYWIILGFCLISSVFMGIGTTYLLAEAFAVIPWLAALPALAVPLLIVPMAVIAGIAYGFLVYNAMTDMIASEMVTTWFKKIGQDLANPKKLWSGVGKICVLSVMFLVTLALSICTAGTWWTVVKYTSPIFNWMSKIPSFIMLVLNPLILSLSTWVFNVENISETLEAAEPYLDSWLGDSSEAESPAESVSEPRETCEGEWAGAVSIFKLRPNLASRRKIIESKDIIFVRGKGSISIWYCDNHNQCKQKKVNDPKIISLIKSYNQTDRVTSALDLNEIKAYVQSMRFNTDGVQLPELALKSDKTRDGVWSGSVSMLESSPNAEQQREITESKNIVFVRRRGHIFMWYCDNNNQCKQIRVNNPTITSLLRSYTQTGKITSVLILNQIKTHLLAIGIRTETWWQRLNPFRLFAYFVFNPLRKLLFLGHLISIGATADQVPGVSPLVPAVLGAISEGVEDIHYFQLGGEESHEHKHDTQSLVQERLDTSGHDHGSDLPSQLLMVLFSPIYFLAACWEFMFSQESGKFSSWTGFCAAFMKAWNKEVGIAEEETVDFTGGDSSCEAGSCAGGDLHGQSVNFYPRHSVNFYPPNAWQTEQAIFRIEKEKRALAGSGSTHEITLLTGLQQTLQARQARKVSPSFESTIDEYCEKNLSTYNRQSFFKEALLERTRTFDTPELCVPCAPGRRAAAAAA